MALKVKIESLGDAPEAVREFYSPSESGGFVLGVDQSESAAASKAKVDEFRKNNVELLRKIKEIELRFAGIDPDEFQKTKNELDGLRDKKLIDEGQIEEVVASRVERMRADAENRMKDLDDKLKVAKSQGDTWRQKLNESVVNDRVLTAINEIATIQPNAQVDVLARAAQVWKVDDNGDPVALNAAGQQIYSADGHVPLTVQEWASTEVRNGPHLFLKSQGGGAVSQTKALNGLGQVVLAHNDTRGFSQNIDAIASGKVKVASQV